MGTMHEGEWGAMKPVWFYDDYRAFLADWIAMRREQGLPCSNRFVAEKMGINSTSWLTAVLKGTKGLSKESAGALAAVVHLDPAETRFFETLVLCTQAKTIDERNILYRRLSAMRGTRSVRHIADEHYAYYGQWYHSAIRALIGAFGFDGNYERLAGFCVPSVTAAQAKASVALLRELALIEEDEQGIWRLTASAVKAEHPRREAVENFQRETMRLAQEALDRFSPGNRDVGTLTLGVSSETATAIRELLADTKRRIVELANADESADRVWQVNFQAFPLSRSVSTVDS